MLQLLKILKVNKLRAKKKKKRKMKSSNKARHKQEGQKDTHGHCTCAQRDTCREWGGGGGRREVGGERGRERVPR